MEAVSLSSILGKLNELKKEAQNALHSKQRSVIRVPGQSWGEFER